MDEAIPDIAMDDVDEKRSRKHFVVALSPMLTFLNRERKGQEGKIE